MKKLTILIPILLISCTATFRGTLLDIEEASIGLEKKHQGEKIIKEILTGDDEK